MIEMSKMSPTTASGSGEPVGRGWAPSGLMREALKNCFLGSRLTLVVVLTISLAVACALLQRVETVSFLSAQNVREAAGWNVLAISSLDAKTPSQIERTSCERLQLDPRVLAAGVVSLEEGEYSTQLSRKLQVARVSASLIPEAYMRDGAAGNALTTSTVPVRLMFDGSPLLLTPLPRLPKGIDLNSSVVLPLDGTTRWFDTCIVVGSPGAPMNEVAAAASASVITKGGEPAARLSVTPWVDNVAAYIDRSSALTPFAAGTLLGLLICLSMRWRSSELGVYRLAGTSRRAILGLLSLEGLIASSSFLIAGGIAGAVLAPSALGAASSVSRFLGGAALIFALAFVGAALMARSDPTRLLGDR